MWIDHLPAVLWADRITTRRTTDYAPFRLMFGQDAVLPVELDNLTWNTAHWQEIEDTSSLLAARARKLERRQEDIGRAVGRLRESREANKRYFDETARLRVEELQLGNLVLMHETRIEQTHSAKLDARWRGPYRIAERAEKLGTYKLEELDGTPLIGWTDGSRLKKFFVEEGQDSTAPPGDP